MNKLKTMVIRHSILFGNNGLVHDGKATLVMEEMIKFHEAPRKRNLWK